MSVATALREQPISTVPVTDSGVNMPNPSSTHARGRLPSKELNLITIPAVLIGWCVAFAHSTMFHRSEKAKRIAELWDDVGRMKLLALDWNGSGSEAPSREARELAQAILLSATGVIVPTRVTASAQGGVGICFYRGNKYGDIECLNTGEILATISDGSGRPQVWEVRLNESKGALERIGQFLNS